MILIDDRSGSADLLPDLERANLPVSLVRLEAADMAFDGLGAGGTSVGIGIELKRLDARSTDLVQSVGSGRLTGDQLPKMHDLYDYKWVLVEGTWRHDDQGRIVVYKGPRLGWKPIHGRITADELEKRMLTLELCAGMHVRYTNSRRDTVRFVQSLYRFWTDKALDKHTSHLAQHEPPALTFYSDTRQALMKWPGVGHKLSAVAERRFKSVRAAAMAGPDEWANLTTADDDGN